jgi:hypothetical protein
LALSGDTTEGWPTSPPSKLSGRLTVSVQRRSKTRERGGRQPPLQNRHADREIVSHPDGMLMGNAGHPSRRPDAWSDPLALEVVDIVRA